MKKFELTKRMQIILITLLVIIVGVIIVGIVSNNKAMGYYSGQQCENYETCGGTIHLFSHTDNTHAWMCNRCWITLEENPCNFNDYSNARVYPNGNETHSWYALCTACGGLAPEPYTNGVCADSNSDGRCDYCTGKTDNTGGSGGGGSGGGDSGGGSEGTGEECTCGGSSSYYEDYRKKDSDLHSCYFVCNICGGEWYDADYIHKYSDYTNNGNGTHTSYCEKDCGAKITQECNFVNGICTECDAKEECKHVEETIPAVEATCTTKGSTAGKKCSVCGEILEEPTDVPALGHNYEDGICTGCGEEEPITEIEITSTIYKIEGTYIYVKPSTKVSDFKSNITTNATEIKVYGNGEELSNDTTIATRMAIELKNGNINKIFTIIVKGDVNSDGTADFKDLVKVNKARLNKITLEEIYLRAADVNEDESLDLKDLSKINRYRLYKITEL